jgi:hypothetical protein
MSTNNASLTVAAAAVKAADTIASVAGQQHARVEAVASDLSARLTEQVEDAFKSAVETGVATHAELIGTRLNAQLEERLNLAKETVASLGALKGEMKSISKSLAADDEGDLTASKLPRHSILDGM